MVLNEYLDGVDLFALIEAAESFPFIVDNDSETLTGLLLFQFGQREVAPAVEINVPATTADYLAIIFKDNWNALIVQEALKLDAKTVREITETREETQDGTNENTNKVTGFNTETLLDDSGSSGTDSKALDSTRILLDETLDPIRAYGFLSQSTQTSIIKTVLHDVANFLTLAIYPR